MSEFDMAVLLSVSLMVGFLIANYAHTHGVPFYVSRKIAHFSAGITIGVFPFVFQDSYWPTLLPLGFLLLLVLTHDSTIFHGFAQKGRLSEVYFALSVAIVIAAAYSYRPWLAVSACLFLAFGDGITGIVRTLVYHREVKGVWGSLAMLVVCLAVSVPALGWVGIPGAVAATVVERWTKFDDNLTIPLVAVGVMAPLSILFKL